jgi:hypothetical protein
VREKGKQRYKKILNENMNERKEEKKFNGGSLEVFFCISLHSVIFCVRLVLR